ESPHWNFDFVWPDDIAAQIAQGMGAYKKRWGILPDGLFPPYFALSDAVLKATQRFRLHWILGAPSTQWGVKYSVGAALVVSDLAPGNDPNTEGSQEWAEKLSLWAVERPFVVINGSQWKDPKSEDVFLKRLIKTVLLKNESVGLLLGHEVPNYVGENFVL